MSQNKGEEKPSDTPQQKDQEIHEDKSTGTYEAGCHCGYIKFSVTLTPALPETKVLNCNCSACTRFGYLLVCESLRLVLSSVRVGGTKEMRWPRLNHPSFSQTPKHHP